MIHDITFVLNILSAVEQICFVHFLSKNCIKTGFCPSREDKLKKKLYFVFTENGKLTNEYRLCQLYFVRMTEVNIFCLEPTSYKNTNLINKHLTYLMAHTLTHKMLNLFKLNILHKNVKLKNQAERMENVHMQNEAADCGGSRTK